MTYVRASMEDGKIVFMCIACPWSTWTYGIKTYSECPQCGSKILTDEQSADVPEVLSDLVKFQKELEFIEKLSEDDLNDRFSEDPYQA